MPPEIQLSPADAGANGQCRAGRRAGAIDGPLDPLGQFRVRDALVRPLRSLSELEALKTAAAADSHAVVGATHLVESGGLRVEGQNPEDVETRIIGYGSLPLTVRSTIPVVNVWLDSRAPNPRRSWELLQLAEALAAQAGYRVICVPCAAQSPFRPHMERFGYQYLGEAGYFLKRVKTKG